MILISSPCGAIVILYNRILNVKTSNGILQVTKVLFVRELRIMIADDDESLVFILAVPFPQRGNYVLAIYSTERPHFDDDNLAAQVRESQRRRDIQPGVVR